MIEIDLYILVILLSAVAFAVMGVEICLKRIPTNEEFKKLRLIRWHLALAYMLMAIFSFTEFMFRDTYDLETTMFFTVSSAAFQIVLISATLTTVLNPAFSTIGRTLKWFGISTAWALPCGIALYCFGIDWAAYLAWFSYVVQLIVAIFLFRKKYETCLTIIDATDKNHVMQFKWVDRCFYVSVALGGVAAAFAWLPPSWFIVYSILCVSFYVFFSYQFSAYSSYIFRDYLPILTEAGLTDISPESSDEYGEREAYCREKVDAWVVRKGFCDSDPDRDAAALKMGIDKDDLLWYLSVCMKTEFRTWRVKLRIEEAKDTLMSNPDAPINELAKALGFVSKANFFAHFKKITGETTQEFVARHHDK